MVPPEFTNFFVASASAGAALVGLLFVAISIAPEHTVMVGAPLERQAVATSAFTALLNAFFISLGALIPHLNLGGITLIMSLAGLSNSLILGWKLLKQRQNWLNVLRRTFLIVVGLSIYGDELYYAWRLLNNSQDVNLIYSLTLLLLGIYGLGLVRAWELLGVRRYGLLGWLSPLRDVNQKIPISTTDETRITRIATSTEPVKPGYDKQPQTEIKPEHVDTKQV